ncbi:unnamed protein product [Schistocephalus solidus]|uniref:Dirigent protein n=1 Tax=Schistocephalus solidus TaxID=70667 RepID=A0A183SRQ1_SCHSO|nr:unnamed protein product [Schistocephalus solidus]
MRNTINTTVRAGQLSDAEVHAAADDLAYVYYVHYLASQTQQEVERLTFHMCEIARGHVKKEPSQPDSQTTSQPLHTAHIGVTVRSEYNFQMATFQPAYSADAAEMGVIQLLGFVREDGPGFRSIKECRHDDGLVHLKFGFQMNTVAISHGDLQSAEGLTGFGDPLSNLVVDSRVA